MSLKNRLRISILSLVVSVVVALSLLNLRAAVEETFNDARQRGNLIAQQVKTYVLERIEEQAARFPAPQDPGQQKELWFNILRQDHVLSRVLEKSMSNASFVIEILVADENEKVLAASDPRLVGHQVSLRESFEAWQAQGLWQKLHQVLRSTQDYMVTVPLGVPGQKQPVITVRVFVSSVLLRQAVVPQLRQLALVSVVSLIFSAILSILVSNLVSRSLERISRNIDRIATGEAAKTDDEHFESKELVDVQTKLDHLGREYRGAKEHVLALRSNVDHLLERLEEAILVFDEKGALQVAGRSAERILAQNRFQLVGRSVDEIFPSWTAIGAAIQSAMKLRVPVYDRPVMLERSNMKAAKLMLNVEMVDPDAETLGGVLVTLRDADTRRQLESQLDVSSRIAAIGRLTSGVAHEIKNPLNAIALHLELARAKLGRPDSGLDAELAVISREISRLDRVVKTFLDFNRPVEPQMKHCDLAEVARRAGSLAASRSTNPSIHVNVSSIVSAAPVIGDCDLLTQAVLNVALNAIEAMDHAGEVEIQVRRVFDDFVVVVTDSGRGIPSEIQDKIFNLYFTTKPSAAGVGLAFAFLVVQLHNGTIDFHSEPGRGTAFHLSFPGVAESEGGEISNEKLTRVRT